MLHQFARSGRSFDVAKAGNTVEPVSSSYGVAQVATIGRLCCTIVVHEGVYGDA